MQKLIYVTEEDCTYDSKEFYKNISVDREEDLIIEPDTALNYYLIHGWKVVKIVTTRDGAFVLIER